MYQVRRGLGDFTATVNGKSITVDSNGNWVPGFWCLNFGSALGIASCATPTAAEISQVVGMSDIGPNVSASLAAAVEKIELWHTDTCDNTGRTNRTGANSYFDSIDTDIY